MAKIDISKITNYATLTAEEKIQALEAYEFEEDTEKFKAAISKANSEAAEWKRKHNALLSDEELKEAERQANEAAIKAEIDSLKKEKSISESKAKLLGLGYDETLAYESAKALADGNMEKFFENQKPFIESLKKTERASQLADVETPPAGTGAQSKSEKELSEINTLRQAAGLPTIT